jgi:hemerythrin-like domain-containing protein
MTTTSTTERTDTWDMVVVHRVFRREFRMAPAQVRAVAPGDTERIGNLADHITNLTTALQHHHTGEDEMLWPLLLERASMHTELINRMEAQHARLHAPLDRIEELLPRWRAGAPAGARDEPAEVPVPASVRDESAEVLAQASVRDELADVLAQASAALDEHLADEEREVLPLVEQYVTPAEWNALRERGMAVIPKGKMALVFLGAILEEATPEEKKRFLAELPAPARLLWRLAGDRVYAKACARIRLG